MISLAVITFKDKIKQNKLRLHHQSLLPPVGYVWGVLISDIFRSPFKDD